MRISDWSSDVCSSDLRRNALSHQPDFQNKGVAPPFARTQGPYISPTTIILTATRNHRSGERVSLGLALVERTPRSLSGITQVAVDFLIPKYHRVSMHLILHIAACLRRAEERSGGKGCVRTCR